MPINMVQIIFCNAIGKLRLDGHALLDTFLAGQQSVHGLVDFLCRHVAQAQVHVQEIVPECGQSSTTV
jgi:hypothetical protein